MRQIRTPRLDLPQRMTVVRLIDAKLVRVSANALDEDEKSALKAYARPACLTGGQHSNA